ncbi:MAG: hypothetical protein WCJ40_05415 [Planctomycetota bacterium]
MGMDTGGANLGGARQLEIFRSCGRRPKIANDPTEVTVASFDHPRRNRRFRPEILGPELLEQREVMAASAMGFSLPNVSVGNYVSPVASWGQPYTVQLQAFNRGASSIPEPLAQFPYASSMADANTTVSIYLTKGNGPHAVKSLLETVPLNTITQNSVYGAGTNAQFTINMPATPPAGFPAAGGQFKLVFVPNVSNQIRLPGPYPYQGSYSVPVKVLPSLPELQFRGSNTPKTLVPGQVFLPEIKLANIGAANISTQNATAGDLQVILVASSDKDYHPNTPQSVILATMTLSELQGLNQRPLAGGIQNLRSGAINNLSLASNQTTVTTGKVTLPTTGSYYIGYIIDPEHKYTQISDNAGYDRSPRLLGIHYVTAKPGFVAPENITNTAAALFPSVPYVAPASYVLQVPNTQQVPVKVAYPPNAALGGLKTKPRGWA